MPPEPKQFRGTGEMELIYIRNVRSVPMVYILGPSHLTPEEKGIWSL